MEGNIATFDSPPPLFQGETAFTSQTFDGCMKTLERCMMAEENLYHMPLSHVMQVCGGCGARRAAGADAKGYSATFNVSQPDYQGETATLSQILTDP